MPCGRTPSLEFYHELLFVSRGRSSRILEFLSSSNALIGGGGGGGEFYHEFLFVCATAERLEFLNSIPLRMH